MALALFLVRDTNTPQKKNTREHHYYQLLVKKKFSPTIQFVGDVLIPKQLIYLWGNTVGLIIFTVLIS